MCWTAVTRRAASGTGRGRPGDAMHDLATLTFAHEEHLDDVMAGYGGHIEIGMISRVLVVAKFDGDPVVGEHGYAAPTTFPQGRGAELLVSQRRPLFGRRRTPRGTTRETPLPFRRRTDRAGACSRPRQS
jgi:hypothetical protein